MILLLAIASPLLKLDLGLPSAGTLPKSDTARTAYDLLARGFGPGINGPLLVVVDAPARLDPVAVAETATKDLAAVPGVASVSPPIQNAAKNVTVVDVIPTSGPSSAATKDLVATIREKSAAVAAPFGVRVLVTGPTALGIDVSAKLGAALPLYLLVVVGIAAILLMLVFRSLLVPLTAVLGFLLTIGAALGAVVWIFQDGHLASLVALPALGSRDQLLAAHDDGHPLRPGHGLRDVPGQPDARGARPRPGPRRGGPDRLRRVRARRHGGRHHHVLRLRQLRHRRATSSPRRSPSRWPWASRWTPSSCA